MDLAGKYLMIWLFDEAARLFLGLPGRSKKASAHRWCVMGMASPGQEAAQGVWVEIDSIQEREPGTKTKGLQEWTVRPATCLIRWDWIISIQIASRGTKAEIGIRPRTEAEP